MASFGEIIIQLSSCLSGNFLEDLEEKYSSFAVIIFKGIFLKIMLRRPDFKLMTEIKRLQLTRPAFNHQTVGYTRG